MHAHPYAGVCFQRLRLRPRPLPIQALLLGSDTMPRALGPIESMDREGRKERRKVAVRPCVRPPVETAAVMHSLGLGGCSKAESERRPRINSAYVISRKRGIDTLPPPVSLHSILRIREEVLIRAADNVDSVWEMNVSFDITLCHLDPRYAAAHVSLAQTGVPMCVIHADPRADGKSHVWVLYS